MRKRFVVLGMVLTVTAGMLAGCGSKSAESVLEEIEAGATLSTEETVSTEEETEPETPVVESAAAETSEVEETTLSEEEEAESKRAFHESMTAMAETTAEDYSIAAGINDDTGEWEYHFVPTKFEVYRDGESHYLMYGATAYEYKYGTWTNTTLPIFGVKAMSLPTELLQPENGVVTLEADDMTKRADFVEGKVYDTSARYKNPNSPVYSIETCTLIFRAWDVPFDGEPGDYTLNDFLNGYPKQGELYMSSPDKFFKEVIDQDTCRYETVGFAFDPADKTAHQTGGMFNIYVRDHVAHCYMLTSIDYKRAFWIAEYALKHSFEFN